MRLYTDHAFHIGKPHLAGGTPCQDYAISGIHGDAAYAIVSDGCSGGRETDVGARLVAHAMKEVLCSDRPSYPLDQLQKRLPTIPNPWGWEDEDLLATCLSIHAARGAVSVRVFGDGVLAFKWKNGDLFMRRYEWAKNAPFYPAYRTEAALANFRKFHGEEPPVRDTYISQTNPLLAGPAVTMTHCLNDGIRGFLWAIGFSTPDARQIPLEYIAVFTDGVTQIDGLSWEDAVRQLLAFKTTEGSFAKRRLMRVVKDTEKTGRGCLDDIAYAVVRIDHEEKKDE